MVKKIVKSKITPIVMSMIMVLTALILSFNVVNARSGFIKKNVAWENISSKVYMDEHDYPYEGVHVNAVPGAPGSVYSQMQAAAVHSVSLNMLYGTSRKLVSYYGELPFEQTHKNDGSALDGWSGYYAEDKTDMLNNTNPDYKGNYNVSVSDYWGNNIDSGAFANENFVNKATAEKINEPEVKSLRLYAMSQASTSWFSNLLYTIVNGFAGICTAIVSIIVKAKNLDMQFILETLHLTGTQTDPGIADILTKQFIFDPNNNGSGIAFSPLMGVCLIMFIFAIVGYVIRYVKGAEKTKGLWSIIGNLLFGAIIIGICLTGQLGNLGQTFANGATKILDVTVNTINGGGGEAFKVEIDDDENQNQVTQLKEIAMIYKPYIDIQICTQFDVNDITDLEFSKFGDNGGAAASSHLVGFTNAADFDNNLGYYYWFANSSAVEKTQNNRTLPTTNAAAAEKKLNSMITYLQNRYNTGTNQSQIKTIIDSFADPHGFSGAGLMFLFAAVMILLGLVLLKYAINVLIAKLEIFISLLGLTLAGPLIISNKKKMVETGKAIIGMLLVSFIEVTVWSIFFDLIIYTTSVIIGATAGRLLITIAFLLLFLKFNPYIAQKIKSFMDKSTNAMCPAFHQARSRAKQKIRQYTRDKAREYGDSEKVVGYDKDGNAITEKRKGNLAHKMMLAAANSLEDPNQRKTLAKINSEGNKERDQQRARSTAELRRDAERRVDEIEQNIAADAQNDQNMINARAKRIREEAAEYDDNGNFIGYNMSKLTDDERAAIQDLKTLEDEERMLTGDKRYKDLLERQRYIDEHNKHLAEGEEPLAMSAEELDELNDYQDRLAQVREDIETKRTEINDEITNRSKIQAAEENGYKITAEDGQDLDDAIADATTIHAQEAHYKEYSDALEAAIDAHAEDVDNPQHQNGSSKLGSKIGTKVNREAVESQAAAELRLKQLKDGKRVANRAAASASVKGIGEIVDREQRSIVGKAAEGLQNVGEVSADARAEDKSRRKLARKVARAESGKVLPGVATSALVSSIVNHDIDSRTVTQIDNDKFSEAKARRKAVNDAADQKANELIANANGVDVATAAASIVADAEAENEAKKPAAATKPSESGKISAADEDTAVMADDNAEPQAATATASAPAPTPVPTAKTTGNLADNADDDVATDTTVNGAPTSNTSKISAAADSTTEPTAEPGVVPTAEPVTQNGNVVNAPNGAATANSTANTPGTSKLTSPADATVANDAVVAENATGKSSAVVNGQPVAQPTGQANDLNTQVTSGQASQTTETATPASGKRFGKKQKAPAPITRKDPITGRVTTVIPNAESAAGVATAATAAAVIANADHRNASAQQNVQSTAKPNTSRIAQSSAQQNGQANVQQTASPTSQPNTQATPTVSAQTADAQKSTHAVNTSSTPQTKINSSKVNADNVAASGTTSTVTAAPIPDTVPVDTPSVEDRRTSAKQVSQPVANQNAPQSVVQNTPTDSTQTMQQDATRTVSTPSTASQPNVKLNSTPQPTAVDNSQAPVHAQSSQPSVTTGNTQTAAADVIRRQENIANAKAQPSVAQPVNSNVEQSAPNTQSTPNYTAKPDVQPSAQPQTSNIAHNNPTSQPTVNQPAQPTTTKSVTASQPKPSTVASVATATAVDNTRNAAPTSQTGNVDSRAPEPRKSSTIHINPTKPQTSNVSAQSVPTSQPANGSQQVVDRAQPVQTTSTPVVEKSPTVVPDTSAPRQAVKNSGTQTHIDTPQPQSVAKPEAKPVAQPTVQPTSSTARVEQPTATRPNTTVAAEAIIAAKSAQRAQATDNATSKPDTSTTQHADVRQSTQNTAPKSPVRQETAKPEPVRHEVPKSEPKTVSAPHAAESSVTPKNAAPEPVTRTAPTPTPAPVQQQSRQSAPKQPTTVKQSNVSSQVDNRTASQPTPKAEPVKPATTQQPADSKTTTTDKHANTQPKQSPQQQSQNPQPARKAENVSTSAPRQPQHQSQSQPQQQSQVKQNQTVSAAESIIAAKSASQAQQNTNKQSTSTPTTSQQAFTQAKPSNSAPTPTPAPAPVPTPAPSKPQPQQTSTPTKPQAPTPAPTSTHTATQSKPQPQPQPATQQTRPESAKPKQTTDSSTTAPKQPVRQDTSAQAPRQEAASTPKSQPATQQTTTQNPAPASTPTKPQPQPAPAPAKQQSQPAPAPAPKPQPAQPQPTQQQAQAQQPAAAPRIKLTSKHTDAELKKQAKAMVEATQAAERAAAAEAARKQAAAAVELKRQKEAEAKRFSSEKHDAAKERKVAQIMEKQAKAQAKAAEKAAKRAQKDAEKAAKRASKVVTSEVAHETARREQALEEAARAARVDRAKATNDRIAHEASERSKDIIAQREQLSAAKQAVGLERRESKSPVSEQDVIANIASDTEALNDMVSKHGDEE